MGSLMAGYDAENFGGGIIYTKYDNENMKFKYYCVYCDYSWNN